MIVFITGVSKGLGACLAQQYLDKGDTVYGISRTRPKFEHENLNVLLCDLADINGLETTLTNFLISVTRFDAVYLNAALLPPIKQIEDCTLEEINTCMDTNTWANKIIIDTVLYRVNHICAITSGTGFRPIGGMNAYCLSKACFNMLINLYALEHSEVKFSLIDPGRMDTEMQWRLQERYKTKDKKTNPATPGFILSDPNQVAKKLIKIIQ